MAGSKEQWCVVGGGILGLRTAQRLADMGHSVTILEAAPSIGGLAESWKIGNVQWDRHYHVTLLSDLFLRDLVKELGLEDQVRWTTTNTEFFADKKFFPLNNALDYLKFPQLGIVDKFRLASTIFYASKLSDGLPLEKIPIEDWLVKLSGRETFKKIWQPLLRAKLGENHRHASAAFIWAIIRRLYAARRSGLKTEMFGYVNGGYRHVFDRYQGLLNSKGVICKTNTPVKNICREGNEIIVSTNTEKNYFDSVVVTTASPLAARLCEGLTSSEYDSLNGILYQGIVCASVVLNQPLHGSYITYITDKSIPYTAVIEMSALVDSSNLDGNSLVYLPCYVPSDDPLFEQSESAIKELFISSFLNMYTHLSSDDILAFRLSKVRHVLAVSTLNYSDKLPSISTSIPGLYIVNSAHIINGTLNVNETLKLADDTFKNVLSKKTPKKPKQLKKPMRAA